jgi:hypothetical protein
MNREGDMTKKNRDKIDIKEIKVIYLQKETHERGNRKVEEQGLRNDVRSVKNR